MYFIAVKKKNIIFAKGVFRRGKGICSAAGNEHGKLAFGMMMLAVAALAGGDRGMKQL